jgi:hypothetical protein
MPYKLITNGSPILGTQLIDRDTGDDVTAKLGARSLALRTESGKRPILEAELFIQGEVDGLEWPDWYAKNPARDIQGSWQR